MEVGTKNWKLEVGTKLDIETLLEFGTKLKVGTQLEVGTCYVTNLFSCYRFGSVLKVNISISEYNMEPEDGML